MSTCPFGGFFLQSTSGHKGNFEVVVPWREGGLAHFWRDNDASGLPWVGPNIFGTARYISASVCESDYLTPPNDRPGHLEVLALQPNGQIDQFWRETGNTWSWFGPSSFGTPFAGNPNLAQAGRATSETDIKNGYHPGFYGVVLRQTSGFETHWRNNPVSAPAYWHVEEVVAGNDIPRLVGAGMILSPVGSFASDLSYSNVGRNNGIGDEVVVAIAADGTMAVYVRRPHESISAIDHPPFRGPFTFGRQILEGRVNMRFRGRPCLIGTSYNYAFDTYPFGRQSYGNYDLIAPIADGGIAHLWKRNGYVTDVEQNIDQGWDGVQIFGDRNLYDEVSMIQSNFGDEDDGHLEVVARRGDQSGFDFYWRDDDLTTWHGPTPVS